MRWTEDDYNQIMSRRKAGSATEALPAAGQPSAAAKGKLQALGRLAPGKMNKTEARFASHLDALMTSGDLLCWRFEAIKLMLAKNTTITVDFATLPASGLLTMIDVKGSKAIYTDDARAKMKIAADIFPFVFQVAYPKEKGVGWVIETIHV
ncbi:hypothetical protein [Martelella sp. AD-3]|uniref:hypothetical protein n=1 Tax=Martelella sp. AD-3 TaxID=686597 RepID=UPI0004656DEE|nr:hypothetical protein [Martelella sp. AD-3]